MLRETSLLGLPTTCAVPLSCRKRWIAKLSILLAQQLFGSCPLALRTARQAAQQHADADGLLAPTATSGAHAQEDSATKAHLILNNDVSISDSSDERPNGMALSDHQRGGGAALRSATIPADRRQPTSEDIRSGEQKSARPVARVRHRPRPARAEPESESVPVLFKAAGTDVEVDGAHERRGAMDERATAASFESVTDGDAGGILPKPAHDGGPNLVRREHLQGDPSGRGAAAAKAVEISDAIVVDVAGDALLAARDYATALRSNVSNATNNASNTSDNNASNTSTTTPLIVVTPGGTNPTVNDTNSSTLDEELEEVEEIIEEEPAEAAGLAVSTIALIVIGGALAIIGVGYFFCRSRQDIRDEDREVAQALTEENAQAHVAAAVNFATNAKEEDAAAKNPTNSVYAEAASVSEDGASAHEGGAASDAGAASAAEA
mmetsp:Transcript_7112/g.17235  ORF Transcript_7112/g.17235 Transcript_7112/m.17235 type:complete len:436 (+) Transcript_7112:171-1478(+)